MMKEMNNVIMSNIEQDHHHLSEDLILEILSYLPPITLFRFKSVSKTWYSLVSNPNFCRRNTTIYQLHCSNRQRCGDHTDNDHHPPCILLRQHFCAKDSNIVIFPPTTSLRRQRKLRHSSVLRQLIDYGPALMNEQLLPATSAPPLPPKINETFMLTDSCNGLLLYVHRFMRISQKQIIGRSFYVCNPITKDYIKLPTIDMVDIGIKERVLYQNSIAQIVFNPSFSHTYKVFAWVGCVKRSRSSSSSSSYSCSYYRRIYVYSSMTRSWRPSVSIPISAKDFTMFQSNDSKAVVWNGVLHWTTLFVGGKDDVCVCYDIEKETVWTMKFPKTRDTAGYSTSRTLLYFGECSGRLLMIEKQHPAGHKLHCFPSWFDVMEKLHRHNGDDDDMWIVRYRVDFDKVGNFFDLLESDSCMGVYKTKRTTKGGGEEEEEEEEEVLLMKMRSDWIITFNLKSNTFGKIGLTNSIGLSVYKNVIPYSVTLLPP